MGDNKNPVNLTRERGKGAREPGIGCCLNEDESNGDREKKAKDKKRRKEFVIVLG